MNCPPHSIQLVTLMEMKPKHGDWALQIIKYQNFKAVIGSCRSGLRCCQKHLFRRTGPPQLGMAEFENMHHVFSGCPNSNASNEKG